MPIPLLGLASILGREYAYSRPDLKERDDILKVVSPQTYYGNLLIQYLADKFNPGTKYDLQDAQELADYYAQKPYYDSRPENRMDNATYDQQMAELSAQVNAPGAVNRFENTLRDLDYGTIDPGVNSRFVGPNAEDSGTFKFYEETLPVAVKQLPSESNFTPIHLEALERALLGNGFEMGPQPDVPDTPRRPDFTPEGSGSGFMPQSRPDFTLEGSGSGFMPQSRPDFTLEGSGSGFMPQGNDKNIFDVQQEYEQYLRGGLTGYRR